MGTLGVVTLIRPYLAWRKIRRHRLLHAKSFIHLARTDSTVTKIYSGPTTHHERVLIAIVLAGACTTMLIYSAKSQLEAGLVTAGIILVWWIALRWIQAFQPQIALAWDQDSLCFLPETSSHVLLRWEDIEQVSVASATCLLIKARSHKSPYRVMVRSAQSSVSKVCAQLQMALESSRNGIQSPYPRG